MTLAILLLAASLAFLILEVFLVSFGTLSIVAIACGVGAVLLAFQENAIYGWAMVAFLLVGGPMAIWGAFKLLPKLPFTRGFYLRAPKLAVKDRRVAGTQYDYLLGATGKAQSPLRPAGTAVFSGDEPVQVVTTGRMLAPGTPIKVIDVTGNRVVVEEVE